MRRDVQLYIQRTKDIVGSLGEDNLVTNGNFQCDELLTNGSFNDSSNWTLGTGFSISSGRAYRSGAVSNSDLQQTITLVSGVQYRVSYEREYVSGGGTTTLYSDFITNGVNQTISSYTSTTTGVVETVTATFTPTYSGTCLFRIFGIADFNGYIDNIRVEAEAGDWIETSNVEYSSGSAIVNVVSGSSEHVYQPILSLTEGTQYKLTLDVFCPSGSEGNNIRLRDSSSSSGGLNFADTTTTLQVGINRLSFYFTATSGTDQLLIARETATGSYTFQVSNVEIREVTSPYQTYENVKVDLFDFEDINITDKIKDIRDVSKVFTGFSQQFTVPASKTNNNLFSHFYNADVVSGFDQRIKHKAFIKIGGADYKEGRVSLTGSSLKNGRPYSYSIVFYGKTVELKDLIGDDELKDLRGTLLDGFNFNYSSSLVNNGLLYGFDFQEYNQTLDTSTLNSDGNPDFFFPMISAENYYFYDSGDGENPKDRVESRNIFPNATTSPRGFYFKDLKPAMKVKFIIRAIEEKYGITFSDDFFNDNNEQYEKLSMLLHREKGNIENQLDETSRIIALSELDWTVGTGGDRRGDTYLNYNANFLEADYPASEDYLQAYRVGDRAVPAGGILPKNRHTIYTFIISFDVAVVGTGEYTIDMYDSNNEQLNMTRTTTGNDTFSWELHPLA